MEQILAYPSAAEQVGKRHAAIRRERDPLASIAEELRDLKLHLWAEEKAEQESRAERDDAHAKFVAEVRGTLASLAADLAALQHYVFPGPPFAEPDACGEAALSLAGPPLAD